MRRFLTIGIKGTGKVDILHGVEKQRHEHIDVFRELAGKPRAKKAKYAEVQVVDLGKGVIKRKFFSTVDGSGKRTTARTVKKGGKKRKPAATKPEDTGKRTIARTVKKAKAKSAKRAKAAPKKAKSGKAKSPKRVPKGLASKSKTAKGDEGTFPKAEGGSATSTSSTDGGPTFKA